MPLQATSGAASYDAFGGGAPAGPATYIEDVFSTWLYTGNGSTQTITNGIDLSTKGGMLWAKSRSDDASHYLFDTVRGRAFSIRSDSTGAQATSGSTEDLTSFNANGFSLGTSSQTYINGNGATFVSWSFRKQPKFFDVVTYTGDGTNRTISHNLGSAPGCMIVKRTDASANWIVYHRSLTDATRYLVLNNTSAEQTLATIWNSTAPTSTVFSLGTNGSVNASGGTYVAYLFAHDAGGFGLTGTDNVISCGSFNNAVASQVTLGWEPQWLLVKSINASNWHIIDTMRGMSNTGQNLLEPNLSNAEIAQSQYFIPTATGFTQNPFFGDTTIYIAIRRGPMKVPTTGTSVYNAIARTGTGAAAIITGVGFAPDWWHCFRTSGGLDHPIVDRLRGGDRGLYSNLLQSEDSLGGNPTFSVTMDGVSLVTITGGYFNGSGSPYINHFFKRAPSYFDICCYTGTGSATTQTHNLGVVPQLIIVKRRDANGAWDSYSAFLANTDYVALSSANGAQTNADRWNSTTPTSSVFSIGTSATTNASGSTYVAYLFATAAGVSKVGSYTGNGTTQTINCGFTGGARFVLIKQTSGGGGDWYTYDTVSGMTTLTNPYISMNTTTAQTATLGSVTTVSTGFALNASVLSAINTNAASYIFLAIA